MGSYDGYVSLVKGGTYERRASLVHVPLFLWGDSYGRDKVFAQANREILAKLGSMTKTSSLGKRDFIYANTSYWKNTSYRFSKNTAEQCAAFVRQAFFKRRYESHEDVPELNEATRKMKAKLMKKFPGILKAEDSRHVGVFFGTMAKSIQAYRTNLRDQTGEKLHTGYVVSIPHNLYSTERMPKDRRKLARLSFKSQKSMDRAKKNKSSERKVYLHDKLSWLEHGTKRQKQRKVYSVAITDYLKLAGFIPGSSFFSLMQPGVHKVAVRSGSKIEKEVRPAKNAFLEALKAEASKELGTPLTITRKKS